MQKFEYKKMRKTIFLILSGAILTLFIGTGCTDKRANADDSLSIDTTLIDTTDVDSLESIISEEPMPKAADELFDDFFFNFAANKKLQRERIIFPLAVDNYGKASTMQQSEWRMEHFHMRQGFSTLIFNSPRQRNLQKNTDIDHVYVERILLGNKFVKRWYFERIDGLWKMNRMESFGLQKHEDANFINFYYSFVTDSLSQASSLAETIEFSGPDPDDDFSRITGEITSEQYPMFAPWLPTDGLFNVHYGAEPYKPSNQRIFIMRGVANGLDTELSFSRIDKKWKLVKFEN